MGASRSGRFGGVVRDLSPGYFALVMASGIISIGLRMHGRIALSALLLVVCATAFGWLLLLNAWRLVAYRDAVVADLTDPTQGFGFFTVIAGGNVLGVRLALDGHRDAAVVLLAAGLVGWLLLGYVIPWTAVLGRSERPLLAKADGSWFVWVVAAQSVATSAATLEPALPALRGALADVAVFSWSVGVCLYAAVGVIVSLRLLLYELRPADVTPPYWVAMGAGAITVLAGARVVTMTDTPVVQAVRGLVSGASLTVWAFATWLVPVLVAAGWWRHVTHRVPLRYEPALWSMVFPMGMYAVAAAALGEADHLPLAGVVGSVAIWFAFAVWLLVFVAMLAGFGRTATRPVPGADVLRRRSDAGSA